MKTMIAIALISMACMSCGQEPAGTHQNQDEWIAGTWQLVTGTLIEKGDTTVTDYTGRISFIKIINNTHFAFLQHDRIKGKDSAVFASGGGPYSLNDSSYTEHLEYCSAREWEGNDFTFRITLRGDTLIQSGTEKVDSAGVDRINIEKYVRVKR